MMARGRPPMKCPDLAKLHELVEGGATVLQLLEHFGTNRKVLYRWLEEQNLEPRTIIPDLPGEEWRPVVGWEGHYEVSNMGRVKTVAHIGPTGKRIAGKLRALDCMHGGKRPYWQVCLMRGPRGGKVFRARVHRLVMEAFVGPYPAGMEICHTNGNGFDNRLENLRYDTHSANILETHMYERRRNVCPSCQQQIYAE